MSYLKEHLKELTFIELFDRFKRVKEILITDRIEEFLQVYIDELNNRCYNIKTIDGKLVLYDFDEIKYGYDFYGQGDRWVEHITINNPEEFLSKIQWVIYYNKLKQQ